MTFVNYYRVYALVVKDRPTYILNGLLHEALYKVKDVRFNCLNVFIEVDREVIYRLPNN